MKIYKYRGGSPEVLTRDLDSIVDNYFWAPTADQLNDPSEAYVNDSDVFKLLKSLNAKEVEKSFDSLLKMRHTVGVYSLSKTPLDELMWTYYGGSHTGFCIEYDLERLILEARASWNVIDLVYHPKPQTIIFNDVIHGNNEVSILEKMIGTKSSRWAHEEEIRIITTTSGKNSYAPTALKGIYFGCRCHEDFILKFRKKLKGRGLRYYKMEFAVDTYSMDARELEYNIDIDGAIVEHIAPIEDGAVPDIKYIDERYKSFYSYLTKAAEIVRRDTSCKKIVLTDFSTTKTQGGMPVIYVQYETNVSTVYSNILNQYIPIEDLQK